MPGPVRAVTQRQPPPRPRSAVDDDPLSCPRGGGDLKCHRALAEELDRDVEQHERALDHAIGGRARLGQATVRAQRPWVVSATSPPRPARIATRHIACCARSCRCWSRRGADLPRRDRQRPQRRTSRCTPAATAGPAIPTAIAKMPISTSRPAAARRTHHDGEPEPTATAPVINFTKPRLTNQHEQCGIQAPAVGRARAKRSSTPRSVEAPTVAPAAPPLLRRATCVTRPIGRVWAHDASERLGERAEPAQIEIRLQRRGCRNRRRLRLRASAALGVVDLLCATESRGIPAYSVGIS